MDTLCGQAWGAQEYRTCGIVLQRGMLIAVTISVPIVMLWAYIEPALLLAGQSPDIVAQAVPYLLQISPVLVMSALAECITKWLTSQVRLDYSTSSCLCYSSVILLVVHDDAVHCCGCFAFWCNLQQVAVIPPADSSPLRLLKHSRREGN